MTNIRSLIEQKKKEEDEFRDTLSDFLYKYINKIYRSLSDRRLKYFQQSLLYVSEWSESKQLKVYNKFLKYLQAKSKTNFDLSNQLEKIISLNVKIMLVLSDNYKNDFITIPAPDEFLYRCIRSAAKAYYDSPAQIEESSYSQKLMLHEIIDWCIQKFIPLAKIFDYASDSSDHEYKSEYVTQDADSPNEVNNIIVEREDRYEQDNQEEIKYLSENEINEYYKSDSDDIQLDNMKHITIRKRSKKF